MDDGMGARKGIDHGLWPMARPGIPLRLNLNFFCFDFRLSIHSILPRSRSLPPEYSAHGVHWH